MLIRQSEEGRQHATVDPLISLALAKAAREERRAERRAGEKGSPAAASGDGNRNRQGAARQDGGASELQRVVRMLERVSTDIDAIRTSGSRLAGLGAPPASALAEADAPAGVALLPLHHAFAGLEVLRIGPSHVALVAPGTVIHPDTLQLFADAARADDSDILFGDEIERTGTAPFHRLHVRGAVLA